MKKDIPVQSDRFVKIGVLMAVLAISFLFYMGNSLYQTSQRMYNSNSTVYALK
ncbi:hypothetical protein [uncultured Bacteroides sp.]|uniref:hypothetical protein n=1 Tax=uncultured Bacteroides sp. TaxID=162156 RepID=UPI002AA93E95|nr:hypothetical protein [uncultured Bacteroides sp.]